jgi:ribosomal subunit interface protein
MLRLKVRFEDTDRSQALEDYAEKRLTKLGDYFDKDYDAVVNVKTYPDKSGKVEFNLRADSVDYKSVATGWDLYKLIDLVNDRTARQIRKRKTVTNRKLRQI